MQTGTSEETRSRRGIWGNSRTWLVAALVVTGIGAGLVAGEVVRLLSYPAPGPRMQESPLVVTQDALTVAVARTPGGSGEWSHWATVIKYLSDELGRPLTVRYLSKEDEAAEVIAAEDIDLAFVCSHHYIDLAESGESTGVCTPIIDGSSTTRSMLVVRADDPAVRFEDLRGARFAVSDKSSLGGYAYLAYLTTSAGVTPEEYCGELMLGETLDENMRDVLEGEARATVVSSAQVAAWDMEAFKVIAESEPVGCPPLIASVDLDAELVRRIQEILVDCDTESLLPADSAIDGFKALDPAEYDFAFELRDACGHHDHP